MRVHSASCEQREPLPKSLRMDQKHPYHHAICGIERCVGPSLLRRDRERTICWAIHAYRAECRSSNPGLPRAIAAENDEATGPVRGRGRIQSCSIVLRLAVEQLLNSLRQTELGMTVFVRREAVSMVSRITRCPTCLGLGRVPPSMVCPTCNGQGTVPAGSQTHPPASPYALWLDSK